MHNISKFILFWNNGLLVSDSLSVHHQESKTVHTGIWYMSAAATEPVRHIPNAVCTVLDS